MIRVYCLGHFRIEDTSGDSIARHGQPKPVALLKTLIALGAQDVPLDGLLDALWPDSEGDAAQIAFASTLYRLRQLLGQDALRLSNRQLSLDPAHVWWDVNEFESILDSFLASSETTKTIDHRLAERLVALYRGPFLSGESDPPAIIPLREQLHSRFLRFIRQTSTALHDNGEIDAAIALLERAAEAVPTAEELCQALMRELSTAGRTAASRATYQRLRRTLRAQFDTTPSESTEQLSANLERQAASMDVEKSTAGSLPARVVGSQLTSATNATSEKAGRSAKDPAPVKSSRRLINTIGFIAGAAILAGIFLGSVLWRAEDVTISSVAQTAPPRQPAVPDGPSIAVLPFTNMSGDTEQDYFADGITEQIISDLARFRDLFVIARNSTFQYKDQPRDVRKIASELRVHYVLEGSVRKATNTVRVTTQLLDGSTGSHLWAETYEADLTAENIFRIQDEISNQVVATIAGHSGVLSRTNRWQAKKSLTGSLQAYECVLLAQDFQRTPTADAHRIVIDCLKRAVEVDPSYVAAWAWLAYVYSFGYSYDLDPNAAVLELSLRAAQEAIRLDPTNQMAHFGMAVSHYFRGEIDAFREEAETAIALNPNNTDVTAVLAEYYAYTVDWDRGIALMRKAMALNPMHPSWYWYPVAKYHLVRGEFDEAIHAAQKNISPDDYISYCVLAYVYATAGQQEEAEQAVVLALSAFPDASVEGVALLYDRWNFPPSFIQRYVVDGLRKAGLPETPAAH
jgi:adenylate cyclase